MYVLSAAGIDTNTFTVHSTHAESSSKAKVQCVPTKEILKQGSWSNNSIFDKFYHKEILPEGNEFQLDLKALKVGINGAFWDNLDQNFQIFNH